MAMKIGVRIESFKQGFESGVKVATALGIDGIQVNVTYNELAPENMTIERIRDVKGILKSNGVCFSAICGDHGKGLPMLS